jgi:RHS repeat-associated protein
MRPRISSIVFVSLLLTAPIALALTDLEEDPPRYEDEKKEKKNESGQSCGSPNNSYLSYGPIDCGDTAQETGDNSSGSPQTGADSLGPNPSIRSTSAAGAIDTPSSVILNDHGGAHLRTKDLSLPGPASGVSLDFIRNHNTRFADTAGDLMGHGRTWSHSFSWRMTAPGSTRRIFTPTGRRLDFSTPHASTYRGQPSTVWIPPVGNGERLHNVGNFWHLVMPGGAAHTFERVVLPNLTVLFHPRRSSDASDNIITYTTDNAARIIRAADSLGNALDLNYSQISLNRKAAVVLHTVTNAPVPGWNEVTITAGRSFRWLQAVSAPNWYFEVSEIEFYESDGIGGHRLLAGSSYGTGPARNNSNRTYQRAFDGDVGDASRFSFSRANGGIAGIDLGAPATITKIRYFIPAIYASRLSSYQGMRFEGMTEHPQSLTVLSSVSASTGDSVEYDYGSFEDASIGQSHAVLHKVFYRNASRQVTDEATISWCTNQQGMSPSIRRAREPRSTRSTPDIAFVYYPPTQATKGQVAHVYTGHGSTPQLIQTSNHTQSASLIAPNGGIHRITNSSSSSYLPSSTKDASGAITSYTWTASGFLASKTTADGTTAHGTTAHTRNFMGQPLVTTHPDSLTETKTYDEVGRLLGTTGTAPGHPARTTTYTRDAQGRVTRITRPDGSHTEYTYNSFGLVTAVRLPNGSFTVHTYDTTPGSPTAGLRLSSTTGLSTPTATTGGETTTFTWHLPGNASGSPARLLASMTDPRGRTTSYEYDHAGRITITSYPDGSFRQFNYDEFGNKDSEFDGSTIQRWTYDLFRRVTTHTDAAGGVTTYNYGPNGSSCGCYGTGKPTLVISPAGRRTYRTHDIMGRILTETRGYETPEAATTSYLYDPLGRVIQTTGPDGHVTTTTYDPAGRPLNITADPAGLNLTTTQTYSPFGDKLTTTLPGGRTTIMAYDKMSRPVAITDPLGTVTAISYDPGGRRTAISEAYGSALARTTGFVYDNYDRLTTTSYPGGSTTSQTYHPGGEIHTSTDELGRITTSDSTLVIWTDSKNQTWTSFARTSTDPAGLTTTSYGPPMAFTGGTRRIVSPAGRIAETYMDELGRTTLQRSGLVTPSSGLTADVSDTVMTHDPDGHVLTSTVDPVGLNLTTVNTYDALGRVKTTTDPLIRTTTHTYDKRGNRIATTLPDNRQHTATFDALSRQLTTTGPKNQTITYTYWQETNQQLTLKDARNFTTTWTYNLRGQLLTKVYPNGDDHAYTYDALGRMATHTTPKNEVCTYSYDARDRQTHANWNTTTPDTAKTYWPNGLLKSIDNGVSKSDYAYNKRNLLISETQTLNGRPARVVSYDYDADGLRSTLQGSAGVSPASYTWTSRAQLQSVSADGPPPIATYNYDKAGRTTAIAHENGITESKSYDAASQLLAHTHLKIGTAVSGHGYTLDATGRRTSETFADGSTPARTYGYDTADQVTSATYGSGQSDNYAYDPMGNRTSATFSRSVGVSPTNGTVTYNANNANQYTTITGLTPITHDANGNLLLQNNASYTWDSENRLVSVTPNTPALGDKSLVHTYDSHHRRATRTTREWTAGGWSNTQTTHFIYDGWNVIEEYDITTATPALVRNLTWGQDLGGSTSLQAAGGVGGLLMVEEITGTTTTAYHFHYDGNGNVTEVTDLNGNPAATYRYDAFGNTLISNGNYANTNRYRFSTKPLDSEVTSAPLYYYGYRYYDPVTGSWPSRDPIEERGGINLYGFVGNNSTSDVDTLGLAVGVSQYSKLEKSWEEWLVEFVFVSYDRYECECLYAVTIEKQKKEEYQKYYIHYTTDAAADALFDAIKMFDPTPFTGIIDAITNSNQSAGDSVPNGAQIYDISRSTGNTQIKTYYISGPEYNDVTHKVAADKESDCPDIPSHVEKRNEQNH